MYELGITGPSGDQRFGLVRVVVPGTVTLSIDAQRPNPSRELRFSFVLPETRSATLEAFDVNGRRVASRSLQGMSAGRHELSQDAPGPASGIYVVRLSQGAKQVLTRAVIVR